MMSDFITGGLSETQTADKEIQDICDMVKNELADKTSIGNFADFTALKYRSQVVSGMNYFVKVQISPDECIHIQIFEPLPCNNQTDQRVFLTGHEAGKTVDDEIEYFNHQYN